MLDVNLLLNLNESLLNKFEARGISRNKIQRLAATYGEIRSLKRKLEENQSARNTLAQEFGVQKNQNSSEQSSKQQQMRLLKQTINQQQEKLELLEKEFDKQWLLLPNLPLDDSIPVGNQSMNKNVRYWGQLPTFSFSPQPHWTILEKQNLVDFKRGVKLAGARFVVYRHRGAKLMRALLQFTLDVNIKNGYEELLPPVLVNWKSFYSSGQFPKFEQDVFQIRDADLYLSSTGEVQLVNFFRNEILAADTLPIALTTSTTNFRAEAGSAGKDIRGIIRLHQFYKTEIVRLCKPEDGLAQFELTVSHACEILEKLNLAYRQVLLASRDMAASSQKTYDLEVWMPGSSKYREISSISYCGTYQSRRAMIRYNTGVVGDNKYVATINGSSLALDRLLAAIVENYQTADGDFIIPPVLSKYM